MKKGVPSVLKQMHKKGSCAKAGSEYNANKRMDSLSTSTRIPSVCVVVVVGGVVGGKMEQLYPRESRVLMCNGDQVSLFWQAACWRL